MIDVKALFRFGRPASFDASRGNVLPDRLERPAKRDFPARSDYNIITVRRWNADPHLRRRVLPVLLFLPTIAALVYFGLVATPRYVAEAKFIVHTAAKASGASLSLSSILQLTGISRSQDDVFSVQDFMTSRDAVARLM